MRVLTMSWLLALTLFCLASTTNARATRKTQLPSAIVGGTVYCDTCLRNDFSKFNHFISGALVAVECDGADSSRPRFRKEVQTNKHGKFKVNLPFSVTKHVKNIKKCSVNLVRSNDANCAVASRARTSKLDLKSIKARTHIFSAGFFTFKPLKQPNICNQKPQISNNPPKRATHKKTSKELLDQKTFFPFPPLIPNPFQPPPAILPPIIPSPPPSIFPPLFPSPPPSIFPPVFPTPPQPPPSIFPPLFPAPPVAPPSFFPPIPGFSPPVVKPPPPPVFPFLPPAFPGVPPVASSSHSKETKQP